MDKDKRTGWLGNLKVGDNVFVRSDFSLKLGKVSKITPTGRITVFNSTFSHLGKAGSGYSVVRLEEATPEKKKLKYSFFFVCKSIQIHIFLI